jgi:hypothetical protein
MARVLLGTFSRGTIEFEIAALLSIESSFATRFGVNG